MNRSSFQAGSQGEHTYEPERVNRIQNIMAELINFPDDIAAVQRSEEL